MSIPTPPAQLGPMQQPEIWSATAEGYAAIVEHMEPYADRALSIVGVGAEDRVLDIATGPGTLAFLAARRADRVVATDFAPSMIDELRRRAAREGVSNVEGLVMDAQALGFADNR